MLQSYERRFRYDRWANQQMIDALGAHPPQPPIAIRWMNHIIAARWLWLERLTGHRQSHPVWPEWSLDECEKKATASTAAWDEYLKGLDASDLLLSVDYVNSKRQPFRSRIQDVLDHVLLHSAYHRGQVASGLRQAGVEPPYTDLIHAARQEFLD